MEISEKRELEKVITSYLYQIGWWNYEVEIMETNIRIYEKITNKGTIIIDYYKVNYNKSDYTAQTIEKLYFKLTNSFPDVFKYLLKRRENTSITITDKNY